jgi:hypothetical protein
VVALIIIITSKIPVRNMLGQTLVPNKSSVGLLSRHSRPLKLSVQALFTKKKAVPKKE